MGKTRRRALITGITGQDGSYLAELLLEKGYDVFGMVRRTSGVTTQRLGTKTQDGTIETYYGDLADTNSIVSILLKVKPDEVYNIGSMSHVRVSFDVPEYTAQVTGVASTRILETLLRLGMTNVKYYQASSSEMYGSSLPPQNEDTPFKPLSPYGAAKLYAYWMTKTYREGYGMFACNGILFNHESPRRGETFVTKKIVRAAVRISLGKQKDIRLGNLDAKRDWGHAKDYCVLGDTKVLIENPNSKYHKVGQKAIKDIKVGDNVLSYNEVSGKKEYDKVVRIMNRKANNLSKVTFSNDNYVYITENHPVAVIRDGKIHWIPVSGLSIGDKVIQKLYTPLNLRLHNIRHNKYSMTNEVKSKVSIGKKGKTYEEMYGKERAKKIKEKLYSSMSLVQSSTEYHRHRVELSKGKNNGNYKHGRTLIQAFCQLCGKKLNKGAAYYNVKHCRSCESRIQTTELWKNEEYRNKVVQNTLLAVNASPNKAEQKLADILNEVCPNEFRFTGNGEIVIHGFNPDFTNINGKKKLVEMFGDYWHRGENPNRKRAIYRAYGFDCLVVWERELKDIESLKQRIETFIFNPDIELVTVRSIEKQEGNYDVFNLETEKYHNYFTYGILVHNCRAIYMIMQHDKPDDFVVSTGEYWTVEDFAQLVFLKLNMDFYDYLVNDDIYRRPNEVPALLGDSRKIREVLGWKPEYNFEQLIEDMITSVMKEEKDG